MRIIITFSLGVSIVIDTIIELCVWCNGCLLLAYLHLAVVHCSHWKIRNPGASL